MVSVWYRGMSGKWIYWCVRAFRYATGITVPAGGGVTCVDRKLYVQIGGNSHTPNVFPDTSQSCQLQKKNPYSGRGHTNAAVWVFQFRLVRCITAQDRNGIDIGSRNWFTIFPRSHRPAKHHLSLDFVCRGGCLIHNP